jgi:hypothetical protein
LLQDYKADPVKLKMAAQAMVDADPLGGSYDRVQQDLTEALTSPRVKLFTFFNSASKTGLRSGLLFLVNMRGDLVSIKRKNAKVFQTLQQVDNELKRLLDSWFDVGFLTLQKATWSSQANILEMFMQYEASLPYPHPLFLSLSLSLSLLSLYSLFGGGSQDRDVERHEKETNRGSDGLRIFPSEYERHTADLCGGNQPHTHPRTPPAGPAC